MGVFHICFTRLIQSECINHSEVLYLHLVKEECIFCYYFGEINTSVFTEASKFIFLLETRPKVGFPLAIIAVGLSIIAVMILMLNKWGMVIAEKMVPSKKKHWKSCLAQRHFVSY